MKVYMLLQKYFVPKSANEKNVSEKLQLEQKANTKIS